MSEIINQNEIDDLLDRSEKKQKPVDILSQEEIEALLDIVPDPNDDMENFVKLVFARELSSVVEGLTGVSLKDLLPVNSYTKDIIPNDVFVVELENNGFIMIPKCFGLSVGDMMLGGNGDCRHTSNINEDIDAVYEIASNYLGGVSTTLHKKIKIKSVGYFTEELTDFSYLKTQTPNPFENSFNISFSLNGERTRIFISLSDEFYSYLVEEEIDMDEFFRDVKKLTELNDKVLKTLSKILKKDKK